MSESFNPTSPRVAREAGGLPEPARENLPQNIIANAESRLISKSVSDLTPTEIFELIGYLKKVRVNIRQKKLQSGVVSRGYEKSVVKVDDGKIGIVPNQNNIMIVGTPQEFLDVISPYENL